MTDQELDEIMTLHWPLVLRRVMADGSDEWIKGFAKSIARSNKRLSWRPSTKQAHIMRRLVSELGTIPDTDINLIEMEDRRGAA